MELGDDAEHFEGPEKIDELMNLCDVDQKERMSPFMDRIVNAYLDKNEQMIAQTSLLLMMVAYFRKESGPGEWDEQQAELLKRKEQLLVYRENLQTLKQFTEEHKAEICKNAGLATFAIGVTVVLWKFLSKAPKGGGV